MAQAPGFAIGGPRAISGARLICEREAEIEAFKPQEYWSIEARLHTPTARRSPPA
jgi:DNA topoisomerase-1